MKKWQYALTLILTNPSQLSESEVGLNARGGEGWEAVGLVPVSGVTGMGKALVLLKREEPG